MSVRGVKRPAGRRPAYPARPFAARRSHARRPSEGAWPSVGTTPRRRVCSRRGTDRRKERTAMLTKEEVAKMPRAERLERLGRAGHELDAAVADRPESVLCRRPDEKNWAPKEVVCHLRDTEEFFMIRFQTLAAAHEPPLIPADPERWAEDRQYIRNDVVEASRAFRER